MIGIESEPVTGSIQLLNWFIVALELFPSLVYAACYFPNGRDMNDVHPEEKYRPCDNDGRSDSEFTMCCAYFDTCRPDGMCLSGWDSEVWRDGCTDPTWQSPSCIKLCHEGTGNQIPSSKSFEMSSRGMIC
jgi:hypothetical protein